MPDLKPFNRDPGIPGSMVELVYALKMKYGTDKQYVTMESASQRTLTILSTGYKVVSATYRDSTDSETGTPPLSTLIIKDPRLDAFYMGIGGYDNTVIIFFNDLVEVQKLHNTDIMNVPFGSYSLVETMQGYVLVPINIGGAEKPILEPGIMESLLSDTDTFFQSREFYKANGINHKRGILILGVPGTGKSSFIKYYLGKVKDIFGLILDCSNTYFGSGLSGYLRSMFGNASKILVLEDIDSVTSGYGNNSAFLNFMDGPNELCNTLFIATTNYPERLSPNLLDRPSRFDVILYFGCPSADLRKEFLIRWFPELATDEARLNTLAESTEGLTGAWFKELATLCGLRRCTIEEALDMLTKRRALLESLGVSHAPMPLYDSAPSGVPMQASLLADYRIDTEMALKVIASGNK